MPKYTYQCDECDHIEVEMRFAVSRDFVKTCGQGQPFSGSPCPGQMKRQLAAVAEPSVMETADPYRNVKHRKDQDARIRKRATNFFRKNEMDEAIEKAGVEEAKKYGWITKDGKKNKGDNNV